MGTQSIFIIGSDKQWEEDQLIAAGIAAGATTMFIAANELHILLNSRSADVTVNGQSISSRLKESRIIFRRTRGYKKDMMISMSLLADRWGCKHTDSVMSIMTNLNKLYCMPTISLSSIKNIPTMFLQTGDHKDVPLPEHFSAPLLAKPVCGRHGEGVHILEHASDIKRYLETDHGEVMLQDFLSIDEEFRIFVVGSTALGVIKKVPKEGSKIANYAAGAAFHKAELPEALVKEAVRLCEEQGIDIGGVDLARVGEEYYLLEINRCPEFKAFEAATGIPVAKRMIDFVLSK